MSPELLPATSLGEAIARQRRTKAALILFPAAKAKRKPQSRITRRDVDVAVNAALDAIIFELRGHQADFPRWRDAFEFARAVVAKHKRSTP